MCNTSKIIVCISFHYVKELKARLLLLSSSHIAIDKCMSILYFLHGLFLDELNLRLVIKPALSMAMYSCL